MSHVRKLELSGRVRGTDKKVTSLYSWPEGEKQAVVEKKIADFRKAFENVTVVIQHSYWPL